MEALPNRRMMSKSESLAEDLAADLQKETDSINRERIEKGKKSIEVEISSPRHQEYR